MYRGRTFNRERVYVCGDYLDGDIYPVFQKPGERRKRCRPTSEIQKKLNQRNAAKRLTRIVHMNFTSRDLALHLTYDPAHTPESAEDALRIVQNYLRALKRRYRKLGLELKYILSTEYGGRSGRVHHHLIVNAGLDRHAGSAMGARLCQQQAPAIWRRGRERADALHHQGRRKLQAVERQQKSCPAGSAATAR